MGLSEQRKQYRSWTAKQKLEIVLAGLRGDRPTREVCREHGISETLYCTWREKLFAGGLEALAGKEERGDLKELQKKIRELERALGRKTYELEIAWERASSGHLLRSIQSRFTYQSSSDGTESTKAAVGMSRTLSIFAVQRRIIGDARRSLGGRARRRSA